MDVPLAERQAGPDRIGLDRHGVEHGATARPARRLDEIYYNGALSKAAIVVATAALLSSAVASTCALTTTGDQ